MEAVTRTAASSVENIYFGAAASYTKKCSKPFFCFANVSIVFNGALQSIVYTPPKLFGKRDPSITIIELSPSYSLDTFTHAQALAKTDALVSCRLKEIKQYLGKVKKELLSLHCLEQKERGLHQNQLLLLDQLHKNAYISKLEANECLALDKYIIDTQLDALFAQINCFSLNILLLTKENQEKIIEKPSILARSKKNILEIIDKILQDAIKTYQMLHPEDQLEFASSDHLPGSINAVWEEAEFSLHKAFSNLRPEEDISPSSPIKEKVHKLAADLLLVLKRTLSMQPKLQTKLRKTISANIDAISNYEHCLEQRHLFLLSEKELGLQDDTIEEIEEKIKLCRNEKLALSRIFPFLIRTHDIDKSIQRCKHLYIMRFGAEILQSRAANHLSEVHKSRAASYSLVQYDIKKGNAAENVFKAATAAVFHLGLQIDKHIKAICLTGDSDIFSKKSKEEKTIEANFKRMEIVYSSLQPLKAAALRYIKQNSD